MTVQITNTNPVNNGSTTIHSGVITVQGTVDETVMSISAELHLSPSGPSIYPSSVPNPPPSAGQTWTFQFPVTNAGTYALHVMANNSNGTGTSDITFTVGSGMRVAAKGREPARAKAKT